MKKVFALIVVILIIIGEGLLASPVLPVDSVGVKWVSGKKFIQHKVKEHEGWYGIARQYDVSYNELRAANVDSTENLTPGQVILVPVLLKKKTDSEKQQSDSKATAVRKDRGAPVTYVVKQKETLYTIAKKYKVSVAEIKRWNQLTSVNLNKGDHLIVGYKKSKENPVEIKPAAKSTELNSKEHSQTDGNRQEIKKATSVHDSAAIVHASHEAKTFPDSQRVSGKTLIPKLRKEVMEQGVATWIDDENINPHKYFALHRSASPGSIIKVTNRMNKRSIFVKVVGKLPDTGDNDNIIIKISKASAEKLGVRDQKFQCELAYGVMEK